MKIALVTNSTAPGAGVSLVSLVVALKSLCVCLSDVTNETIALSSVQDDNRIKEKA